MDFRQQLVVFGQRDKAFAFQKFQSGEECVGLESVALANGLQFEVELAVLTGADGNLVVVADATVDVLDIIDRGEVLLQTLFQP